ncbi:MAG: type III polyketide synthase [Acidobacteriota bacterium]
MSLRVIGLGTAAPEFSVSQAEVAEVNKLFCPVDERRLRLIPPLYRRAGVDKRHSVLLQAGAGEPLARQSLYWAARDEDDHGPTTMQRMLAFEGAAPALSALACRAALEDAAVDGDAITHLVTVSCTGFHAPGNDARLIEQLGLRRTVNRTHVGFMGCHGALNGLRVADSFVGADAEARVLLCAVELCTLHFYYGWDAEKIVANSLFGDGAGALVGAAEGAGGAQDDDAWRLIANGTYLMPNSRDAMTWRIGDHGFHMTLSSRVPGLIREHLAGWLDAWLADNGLAAADVATWAVHPGGPRILDAVVDAMALADDALAVSREVLREFGNMSSATLLFILERLRRRGAPRPCVALGFGPGMVVEAALLR